jgi:hypothetical protein
MKRAIVLISLALLGVMVFALLAATRLEADVRVLSQDQFFAMFESNSLAKVRVYHPPKLGQVDGVQVMLTEVRGAFYQDGTAQVQRDPTAPRELPFIARVHFTPELEARVMARTNVVFIESSPVLEKVGDWIRRHQRKAKS